MKKKLDYIKIPNKFGVKKEVQITSLNEKQLGISIVVTDKELNKIQKEVKFYRDLIKAMQKEDKSNTSLLSSNIKNLQKFLNIEEFLINLQYSLSVEVIRRNNEILNTNITV